MSPFVVGLVGQAAENDEVDLDLGKWASDNPWWAVLVAAGVVLALVLAGRWLIERPVRIVVLVVAIGAAIVFGQAQLIPFALITFLVIGVVSAPFRWWRRRSGPLQMRSIPDEPPPMENRCTWPSLGYCPVHPRGHDR
ncbi:MAG: hypothetical protein KF906_08650 [Actinobacteria bacterium]|nr:hypothetical protein [Actinomycetota bacterium]